MGPISLDQADFSENRREQLLVFGMRSVVESQAAGPFSNASLSGLYVFGTESPSASRVSLQSGVLLPNGAAGTGSGTSDTSGPSGLSPNQPFTFTYTIDPDGTGTITESSGNVDTVILISGNNPVLELVLIPNTDPNPSFTVVHLD